MLSLHQIVLAASTLFSGVSALPQLPLPFGETTVTGYPICNVSGYTFWPGNYTETTYQQQNSTLSICIQACRANSTCDSIAWVPPSTSCIFYNTCVEKTLLIPDNTSSFFHYDNICDIV